MKLEYVDGISVAHPYTKGIEHEFHCKSEVELDAVTRGHFSPEIAKQTAKDIEGVTTGRIVYTSTYYIGLGMKPKDGTCSLHHTHCRRELQRDRRMPTHHRPGHDASQILAHASN